MEWGNSRKRSQKTQRVLVAGYWILDTGGFNTEDIESTEGRGTTKCIKDTTVLRNATQVKKGAREGNRRLHGWERIEFLLEFNG